MGNVANEKQSLYTEKSCKLSDWDCFCGKMKELKKRKFRSENKYIVNIAEIEVLRNRIMEICEPDQYSEGGEYGIRSLYFDDYTGSSYYDNEIGVDPREKYRVRIYNCSTDVIVLERKIKVNGKISKDRAFISKHVLDAVMEGRLEDIDVTEDNPLLNRFLQACYTQYLRPTVIVDYVREAYVSEIDDIRITFDKEISFSSDVKNFLDPDLFLQPIMPVGKELMEVKYTEFLPEHIHQSLNLGKLQQTTFSKYYLSEKTRREVEL